ncbi:MAG: Ppx/GppA family phosphatase [Polyangiaceae bacterium]|nr:Ppx/GppA family phosphatase [Polyangiaceae bacterium]
MARLGAIDIGSNAIRLRIVDVDAPEPVRNGTRGVRFRPFREVTADRVPVRLGHDVFTRGRIEPTMIAQACDALRSFRATMDDVKVERYRAVATSACREAKNADVFVERAEREAGVHVEVIEGVEEARLVQIAVRERLNLEGKTAVLIDIGGGSTEITVMKDLQAVFSRSLPVGTVRLIEAFLEGGGRIDEVRRLLLEEYIQRVSAEAVRALKEAAEEKIDAVIATGGNIETLADLAPLPQAFPESRGIEVAAMNRLCEELCSLNVEERIQRYSLRPDRADTIVPATKILTYITDRLGTETILAPGVGLKEGVLVDLATLHFVPRDFSSEAASVRDACVRLGQRYHFDEAHGRVVADFCMSLFDDLSKMHGLEPRDRVLLLAAGLLHDIGDFVRYEGHHKHSYYIIAHSDIMGLTPSERELVANVARYHRKSPPALDHENFRALSREGRTKVKMMASILRLADALDREHRQVVSKVSARIEGGVLLLDVEGNHARALEEWTVRAKSGMLRESLGIDVRIVDPIESVRQWSAAASRG